jgi:ubiquinone/menaquinone biosynthesis C-methylase UbiE
VKGKDVLDVGCGYGYGVELFSRYARSVVGIDYEREVIRYARRHHKSENSTFKIHDANTRYPFDDGSFDLVFVSNVIEQLKEYEYSLTEMRRVLREGGEIIIKTRNKRYVTERNPYHVVLFNEVEIVDLLKRYFVEVELRGYNILYSHRCSTLPNSNVKKEYPFGAPIPLMYKYEIEGLLQAVMVDRPEKAGFLIVHGKKSTNKRD